MTRIHLTGITFSANTEITYILFQTKATMATRKELTAIATGHLIRLVAKGRERIGTSTCGDQLIFERRDGRLKLLLAARSARGDVIGKSDLGRKSFATQF